MVLTDAALLYHAVRERDMTRLQALLELGVHVDESDDDGWTAFGTACEMGHLDFAQVLFQNGADVNVKDSCFGLTPLHHACGHEGSLEVARWLAQRGADVNARENHQRWTPFHNACANGYLERAKLLFANGADIHAKTKEGHTSLHLACANDAAKVVKWLYENGANDLNVKDTDCEWTALHHACDNCSSETTKFLIDNGAEINVPDDNGDTPLHRACQHGMGHSNYLATILILIDNGASIHQPNFDGETPLHVACKLNKYEVAQLLLSRGGNVNLLTNNGLTPLDVASERNHPDVVPILVRHNPLFA